MWNVSKYSLRKVFYETDSYIFQYYIFGVFDVTYYLVNPCNNKSVSMYTDLNWMQKNINKVAIHLNTIVDLLYGDEDCVTIAQLLLGLNDETKLYYPYNDIRYWSVTLKELM